MEIESSFSAVSASEEMDRQFETFTRKLSAMPSFQLFSSKENDENESEMEDLSALKEKFDALRKKYLVSEKKKRLLEIISSNFAMSLCKEDIAKEHLEQSERKSQESKENLQSLQLEINRMQQDCGNFYQTLVSAKESLPANFERIKMQKQSLQEMKSELDRLVNVEKVFEKKTLDELKPVLAEQLKVKVAIDQENSQKTALLHELGNTVQEKKAQVDALKETVEKLEAKASAGRETLQQQKRRRQELSNWYENALKLLQKVFGASVQVEPENSLIKVKFGPLRKDLWITCAIKMDDTTADILSVEISPRPYPVQDLVEEAKTHRDIGKLVRDLWRRVYTFWAREQELLSLIQSGWTVDYDPIRNPDIIKANIFGDKLFSFKLSRDYPRPFMDKECSEPQKSIEIMWNDHLTGLTEESRVQMEKIAAENQNLSKLFEALRNQPNLNL